MVGGTVADLGNQTYGVHGDQLVYGVVAGFPLSPDTTNLDYTLNAHVNGVNTNGNAHVHLEGTIPGSPATSPITWTSSGGTLASHQPKSQGCDKPDKSGQMQCEAQFTSNTAGAVVVTATYPGDGYNSASSDSYTIFVGNVDSSPATSTSISCDQARLQAGQSTNCRAVVTVADSSAQGTGVVWTSNNGGTFSPQPPGKSQGCNKPDHDGQMQCQAQFTAGTAGPTTITATYAPSDSAHVASSDSYTVFVGVFGASPVTGTSLTCDHNRLDATDDTKCHATVLTSYAGTSLSLDIAVNIDNQIGMGVPIGCDSSGSTTPCNSLLPAFFVGGANVELTVGKGHGAQTTSGKPSTQPQMMLESPYWNPWGAPILVASADGTITLVSKYSVGTVDWERTVVTGIMSGVVGTGTTTNAIGAFSLVSNEHEDLVAGTTKDSGTMTFSHFVSPLSITPITISGIYKGSSVVPMPGSPACDAEMTTFGTPCVVDCSSLTGFPGTCTVTGFQSNGIFALKQGKIAIAGAYSTIWSVPALGFASSVAALATQQ